MLSQMNLQYLFKKDPFLPHSYKIVFVLAVDYGTANSIQIQTCRS